MARTRGMGAGAASRSGDSRSPEREEGGDERRPYQSLGPVDDLLIAPWIKIFKDSAFFVEKCTKPTVQEFRVTFWAIVRACIIVGMAAFFVKGFVLFVLKQIDSIFNIPCTLFPCATPVS